MSEAALAIYTSLDSIEKIQEMINNGDTETLHLECKAPHRPQLDQKLQVHLSRALSGFSNTAGGVMLYGVETDKHSQSKLDVLTQIVPVGNCDGFARQVQTKIPSLTTPSITNAQIKTLKQNVTDTKGVVVVCVLQTSGDPVQTVGDKYFYYHTGTGFEKCPHEMIKRLFAATESPQLVPNINREVIKKKDERRWELPIRICNLSSAIAEHAVLAVKICNAEGFESITTHGIKDISYINPGKSAFIFHLPRVVHRGLPLHCGSFFFTPKSASNKLELEVTVFANKMRATKWRFSVVLDDPPDVAGLPGQYV